MAKEMNVKVLHVSKTTAQWAAETTVISKGLLCVEFTTDGKTKLKVGDGTNTFAGLAYVQDGTFNIGDYYTSAQTDTKISDAITALGNIITIKGVKATVDELPTADNKVGDLWFVGADGDTTDNFTEYVWTTSNKWEYLGKVQTEIDLSGYALKTEVQDVADDLTEVAGRVTTLEGATHTHDNAAVLNATTASFTTEEKEKLAGIAAGATNVTVDSALSDTSANPVENKAVKAAVDAKVDKVDGKGLSTNDYTTAEKEKLAGIAEGANKTVVDSAISADSTNPVENKVVSAALDSKVDKVTGKGLSTNDFTDDLKAKLDGIEAGANKITVDAERSTTSENPVQNKVIDAALSALEADQHTHANADVLNATTASFTTEEKEKLAGIAAGATSITVDTALSADSANPVENKAVKAALDTKVDAVEGKGLSTNDYTTAEKEKLAGVETGANKTVVDAELSTSSENPVQNKVVNTALGTKVDKVEGMGLSTNDYTTAEKEKLAAIEAGANKTVVDTALSADSANPVENKAVKAALDTKVDAVEGKGLSTNDYTTAEKEKLASLENYDDTALTERVAAIEADYIKSTDTLVLNCTL